MNTVYLVDDDRYNLDQFLRRRNIFLECGFEIAGSETNPLNAFNDIINIKPDVVLSDLKMPVMDGIGLMSELQRDAERRDDKPPVFIIVSAYNDYEDVRRFFKHSGFDYIVKPVTDFSLTETLNGLKDKIDKRPPVTGNGTDSEELNGIIAFLREYPAMNHTLKTVSERAGLTPKAVCKLFSKYLNTTFIVYLTQIRMEKAEELLRETDSFVKKIGQQCGYPDHFYFTRVFTKNHDGMTPTEYREAKVEEQTI